VFILYPTIKQSIEVAFSLGIDTFFPPWKSVISKDRWRFQQVEGEEKNEIDFLILFLFF